MVTECRATQNEKATAIVKKPRFEDGFVESWVLKIKGKNGELFNKRMYEWND